MNQVRGMREDEARAIAQAMAERGPFPSIERLWRASGVRASAMKLLAGADAFRSMGLDRQSALWHAGRLRDDPLPLFDERDAQAAEHDERVPLPELGGLRHVTQDYQAAGISLRGHPVGFLRGWLDGHRAVAAADLLDERQHPQGRRVMVAGICLVRQRPGTARNITFMTLEDETGTCNLVVFPDVFERYKAVAGGASAMMVRGRVERQGEVIHVRAERFWSLDGRLAEMRDLSRNFR